MSCSCGNRRLQPMSPPARLGALLVFKPSTVDRAFWHSAAYRSIAASVDWWTLWQTCVFNLLSIRFFRRAEHAAALGGIHAYSSLESWFIFWIASALLQALWRFCTPEHYWRWRYWVLLFNRASRLYIFLQQIHAFTTFSRAQILGTFHAITSPHAPPPGAHLRLLTTFRTAILASHAALPLLHACNTPLPFLPQLAFHSIYLAALLAVALPTTLTVISAAPAAPPSLAPLPGPQPPAPAPTLLADMHHLCEAATSAMHALHTTLCTVPWDPSLLRSACHPHGPTTVLLFGILLLGFLLPVYMAYRIEAHAKTLFLTHLLKPANPPPPPSPPPGPATSVSSSIRSPSLHCPHRPHRNHSPASSQDHLLSQAWQAAEQLRGPEAVGAAAARRKAASVIVLAASRSLPHWTDALNVALLVFLSWAAAMHLSTHVHVLYLA